MALDLFAKCPPYSPEPRLDPETHVKFYALRGKLEVKTQLRQHELLSLSMYEWDNLFGYAPHPATIPRPDWWTPRPPTQTSAAREMEAALDSLRRWRTYENAVIPPPQQEGGTT